MEGLLLLLAALIYYFGPLVLAVCLLLWLSTRR